MRGTLEEGDQQLEGTQPPCSITFSIRPRIFGPLSAVRQEVLRNPGPLLEVSQSRIQEAEGTGKTEEYEWEREEEGVEAMEEGCWRRGWVASKGKF